MKNKLERDAIIIELRRHLDITQHWAEHIADEIINVLEEVKHKRIENSVNNVK